MSPTPTNHDTYRGWLELELDGRLGDRDRATLDAHTAECAACAEERRTLARLGETLAAARVAVRPDFRSQVMAALPDAGWEARARRAWLLPAALVALLAGAAAALLGFGAARLEPLPAMAGAARAVVGLLGAALEAGAGLLGASWRGIGLGLASLLSDSPLVWGVLAFGVLCLNLLFFRLLRRRRPAADPAVAPRRPRV
jgi:hypothetical protein